jgi:glycosyltransferase involved in cell wall biosynthesis
LSVTEHTPKITVLLPVYNAAQFLRQAIDSILSQTFSDFELLIVNDGSTDSSAEIISSYSDSRIRVLKNEKNIGLIASLNRGIAETKGKYIARMDADDISLPDRLQQQVTKMESDPGIAVLSSFVDFMNVDGDITGTWSTDREATSESEIRKLMMRTNCIAHPTVMMRTDVIRKYLFNPKRKGSEDWDLWMRLLASGHRIAKLPEVLLNYRVHPGSVTASDKQEDVLEVRLIRFKRRWLWSQFSKLRLNGFFFGVKWSLLKNIARHLVSNKLPHWGRDVKRLLTSPPWKVMEQGREFREALAKHTGQHFFIFPYTHVGGAEIVHADIVRSVADKKPLVFFSGFSENDFFLWRFTKHAKTLDIAHYVNYPFTRKKAKKLLSDKINASKGVVFGCNAGLFYDIIPMLATQVKVVDLIHAFKYQPEANLAHRKLLHLAGRIDHRIFVSEAAKNEFGSFCFHNNIPAAIRDRRKLITNSVDVPKEVSGDPHEKYAILWVGRDSPEKRYGIFSKIRLLLMMKEPEKFRFSSVGVSDVSGEIQSHGELFDGKALQKVYRENDILLVTSSREGFPMVIMEAMAEGLIVISTPVGDVPNRLDGTNGIVLKACEDEKEVALETVDVIRGLVADPERMKSIRNEAHAFALKHYSIERFDREYREVLSPK